jgi:Protein of unknown function (DUF4197)
MSIMKKISFLIFAVCISSVIHAQGILGKLNKAVKGDSSNKVLSGISKAIGSKNGGALSNDEIISGLKQALTIGTDSSAKRLNKADGFFANAAIKILMPAEAKKAESTLRKFGMGSLVDKAILSMNRAAEDAAGGISTIFWDAIKGMTLTDGLSILRGGDFAATDYLKKSTTAQLTEKMRPVIEQSLAKVDATKYWKDVFTAYNKFSKEPVNTDISAYVTEKSMAGIFYSIGQEEQKIRKDPAAQVTDLLKKVFAK